MSNGIKKIAWAFGVVFILASFSSQKAEARPYSDISLQVFYDELSSFGDWVDNPDYGYVWRPDVGRDFRPYYTNGHWVMTKYGNTWVSDYEWGWAPFHYGRWFHDRHDGWIWAPDTEWGPAWVTWRTGGGYYGWAPLAPRVNININFGRHHYVPDNYWVFIPQRCIYYPSYSRYWEPRRNVYIVNNTTIINNIYTNDSRVRYYSGPSRDNVQRATRREVPVYRVSDNSRPGSDRISRGEVNIYRPNVDRTGNAAPRSLASNSSRPSRGDGGDNRSVNSTDRSGLTSSTARPERSDVSRSDSRNTNGTATHPDVDRSSNSSRPERNEVPRTSEPTRTEATRSSAPSTSPQRTEAPISRPERMERVEPAPRQETQRSAPAPSPQRSEAPAPSSRPERMERSEPAPRTQSSSPSRSAERSSAPSSSSSRSSSPSSRDGGSGRPSR